MDELNKVQVPSDLGPVTKQRSKRFWIGSVLGGLMVAVASIVGLISTTDLFKGSIYDSMDSVGTIDVNVSPAELNFTSDYNSRGQNKFLVTVGYDLGDFDVTAPEPAPEPAPPPVEDPPVADPIPDAPPVEIPPVEEVHAVITNLTATQLDEGGTTASYEIVLASAPTADVLFELTPNNQCTTLPEVMNFDPTNWSVPQTFNVEAVDDQDYEPESEMNGQLNPANCKISVTQNGVELEPLFLKVYDNDPAPQVDLPVDQPGVEMRPLDGIRVSEEGETTSSFSMLLTSTPSAQVTYTFESDQQCTVTGQLQFDSTDWYDAKTVDVTAVDDADIEDPEHPCVITVTETSDDTNYNRGLLSDISIVGIVTDNDVAEEPAPDGSALGASLFTAAPTDSTAAGIKIIISPGDDLDFAGNVVYDIPEGFINGSGPLERNIIVYIPTEKLSLFTNTAKVTMVMYKDGKKLIGEKSVSVTHEERKPTAAITLDANSITGDESKTMSLDLSTSIPLDVISQSVDTSLLYFEIDKVVNDLPSNSPLKVPFNSGSYTNGIYSFNLDTPLEVADYTLTLRGTVDFETNSSLLQLPQDSILPYFIESNSAPFQVTTAATAVDDDPNELPQVGTIETEFYATEIASPIFDFVNNSPRPQVLFTVQYDLTPFVSTSSGSYPDDLEAQVIIAEVGEPDDSLNSVSFSFDPKFAEGVKSGGKTFLVGIPEMNAIQFSNPGDEVRVKVRIRSASQNQKIENKEIGGSVPRIKFLFGSVDNLELSMPANEILPANSSSLKFNVLSPVDKFMLAEMNANLTVINTATGTEVLTKSITDIPLPTDLLTFDLAAALPVGAYKATITGEYAFLPSPLRNPGYDLQTYRVTSNDVLFKVTENVEITPPAVPSGSVDMLLYKDKIYLPFGDDKTGQVLFVGTYDLNDFATPDGQLVGDLQGRVRVYKKGTTPGDTKNIQFDFYPGFGPEPTKTLLGITGTEPSLPVTSVTQAPLSGARAFIVQMPFAKKDYFANADATVEVMISSTKLESTITGTTDVNFTSTETANLEVSMTDTEFTKVESKSMVFKLARTLPRFGGFNFIRGDVRIVKDDTDAVITRAFDVSELTSDNSFTVTATTELDPGTYTAQIQGVYGLGDLYTILFHRQNRTIDVLSPKLAFTVAGAVVVDDPADDPVDDPDPADDPDEDDEDDEEITDENDDDDDDETGQPIVGFRGQNYTPDYFANAYNLYGQSYGGGAGSGAYGRSGSYSGGGTGRSSGSGSGGYTQAGGEAVASSNQIAGQTGPANALIPLALAAMAMTGYIRRKN